MGSKKRSAREKQKMAFLADLGNENMGVSDSLFAAEDKRRDRMHAKHEEALRYKSCERKMRYNSRLEASYFSCGSGLLSAPPMDAAALLATNAPGAEVGTSRLIRSDNAGAAERWHL